MVTINKHTKVSSHMAPMPVNDRTLIKQIMRICFSSVKLFLYDVNVVQFKQPQHC